MINRLAFGAIFLCSTPFAFVLIIYTMTINPIYLALRWVIVGGDSDWYDDKFFRPMEYYMEFLEEAEKVTKA